MHRLTLFFIVLNTFLFAAAVFLGLGYMRIEEKNKQIAQSLEQNRQLVKEYQGDFKLFTDACFALPQKLKATNYSSITRVVRGQLASASIKKLPNNTTGPLAVQLTDKGKSVEFEYPTSHFNRIKFVNAATFQESGFGQLLEASPSSLLQIEELYDITDSTCPNLVEVRAIQL